MATEMLMTQEGYEALKKELNELKSVTRGEISEKIRVARGFGDLSENSEYDEAKNEQAVVEADRKSTRLNSSHRSLSRMPSSA